MTLPTFGLDLGALPAQFEGYSQGRVLVLDGDGPAYVAAATVKRLDTAIRRFQTIVLERMYLTKSEMVSVHLTKSGSLKAGRGSMRGVKPYQANRSGKAKPSLLEPLREAIAHPDNWLPEFRQVVLHEILEADDGMIAEAEELQHTAVICSEDKDLRMTRWMWYCIETGRIYPALTDTDGAVELKFTPSGTPKLAGRGPLFFWGQMLAGDTADNVRGLERANGKLCGVMEAHRILGGVTCQHTAANAVLDLYASADQNPLPEGYCLWLLRRPGDSFIEYLRELRLTESNTAFIKECYGRHWYDRP